MNFIDKDPNPTTKQLMLDMIHQNGPGIVDSLFEKRLEFGTAGLRGPMGLGSCCMNDLVILQTCQGLADYLLQVFGEECKDRGVVVGFDHRENKHFNVSSRSFAIVSAIVFLRQNFKVYFLEDLSATPLVPFAVQSLHAIVGIMVTASHNPKQDNGFKVYWENGAQLNSPHNIGIEQAILRNLDPVLWEIYQPVARLEFLESNLNPSGKLLHVSQTIIPSYLSEISSRLLFSSPSSSSVKICYTAMHGVGYRFINKAFELCGFQPVVPVVDQVEPDYDFPTVKFPNPEEAGALDLAKVIASENHCQVIIANDPDVDRLGLAEFNSETNCFRIFTGDEIGAIFAGYCFENRHLLAPSSSRYAMVSSAVSSRFVSSFCLAESIEYHDTLTGFKHIGNKSLDLRREGVFVLFSYEEALGYCIGNVVVDKDGIGAAVVMYQLVHHLYDRGLTCDSYLKSLYHRYGQFSSCNHYMVCKDPIKMNQLFQTMRRADGDCIIDEVNGNRYKIHVLVVNHWQVDVVGVRDVTTGFDSTTTTKLCALPTTPSSQMITFQLQVVPPDGLNQVLQHVTLTIRGSGTEPKIKYYCERRLQAGSMDSMLGLRELTTKLMEFYLPMN